MPGLTDLPHRVPRGAMLRFGGRHRRLSRAGHGLALLTVLLVGLTAIGLGHARGLVMQGGAVVLCAGDHVVTLPVPGHPGQGRKAVCPDMAAGLLSAIAVPPPLLPRPAARGRRAAGALSIAAVSTAPPLRRARGPPFVLSST